MQRKRERALEAVEQAMSALNEEMARHERGEGRVGNIHQLRGVREQLEVMHRQLSGNLPPREHRVWGAGRMIVDEWPLNSELGNLVLRAEQAYRNLP